MAKQYYKAKTPTTHELVDRPEDATADYAPAAEATQKELERQGIHTTLVQVPTRFGESPKFVVCIGDISASVGAGIKAMKEAGKPPKKNKPPQSRKRRR